MANTTDALMSYLRSRPVSTTFTPCAYYGSEEDAMVFYFRNGPDYAKRVNEWLTLYLSMEDGELLGCQVKGIARVLEDIGHFGVDITHGSIKVSILFLAFLGSASEDPGAREYYRQLGEAARETELQIGEHSCC